MKEKSSGFAPGEHSTRLGRSVSSGADRWKYPAVARGSWRARGKALDDDVVCRALMVFLAAEGVVAVGIMGGPTLAGGAGAGAVDGETQLAE